MRINVQNPVNCWNTVKLPCQSVIGNDRRNVLEKLADVTIGNQQPIFSGMRRRFNEQGMISRSECSPTKAGSVHMDTMMCSDLASKEREDRIKSLSITFYAPRSVREITRVNGK